MSKFANVRVFVEIPIIKVDESALKASNKKK